MSDPSGCSNDKLGMLITLPSQSRLLAPRTKLCSGFRHWDESVQKAFVRGLEVAE